MSMVLRSGRAIIPYYARRYTANSRVIQNVASKAMKYRRYGRVIGTMNRAMRNPLVRRGFMKFRAKLRRGVAARKKIGFAPGTTTTRFARQFATFDTTVNDRTLFSVDVTDIPRGINITERIRDVVEFRGIRLCYRIRNLDGNGNMYHHWALISPKTDAVGVSTNNFFRSDAPQTTGRGRDFDNTLDAHEFHCLPINPDKWNIIRHRKYTLGTITASSSIARTNDSWREIREWIPIKRQLRYDDDNVANTCSTPIFFVHWSARWNSPGGTAPTAVVNTSYRIHAYFNNPKNV